MRLRHTVGVMAVVAACLGPALSGAPAAADDTAPREPLLRIADPRITESSGLAASATLPGVLWTVNDSGGTPQVFGIAPSGLTVATLTLSGATNRDWEAVAVGPRPGGRSWIWVGDIGDNLAQWPSIRVYRVAEPTTRGTRSVRWTAFDLVYPAGPRDAESLLVDPANGRLYIVSKRVQGAAVYAAPLTLQPDRVNRLVKVTSAPPLVTDGAFAPDGRVAIRDYLQAWVSSGIAAHRTRVTLPLQPQGESLTWTRDGAALLVGSEGEQSEVWRVQVVAPAAASSPAASPSADRSASGTSPPTDTHPTPASDRTPWLVAAAGLLVGAVLALAARRRRARTDAGGPDRASG